MHKHRPVKRSSSLPGLPDRSGLRRLAEEVVQLTGADGGDQRVDQHRELILRADDEAGLALRKLDGLGPKLDRHDDLAGGVGLPPGPDGLLLGGGFTACLLCRVAPQFPEQRNMPDRDALPFHDKGGLRF